MADIAYTLLQWFREYGRALPWRQTTDPYAIWLSEVILQQTRVQQGTEYWYRFIKRWPDVQSLANATEDEVLREWQGLGYYSRARNLHTAAKQIVSKGYFPQTIKEIKTLKGIGDYTAAAIASIAFGVQAAVVDGNVYRVLARYFAIDTPINSTKGKKEFTAIAQALIPSDQPAAYNQAIMDFGAIQCTPKNPKCPICPLQETCKAYRDNKISLLPVKNRKLKIMTRRLVYIYIRQQNKVLLRRRPAGDIWEGLWEPWLADDFIEEQNGPSADIINDYSPLGDITLITKDVKHVLTHRILMVDFYLIDAKIKFSQSPEYQWIDEQDIKNYALPRVVERLFKLVIDNNTNIK